MKLQDFDYVLPQELIAQKPADKRDSSRLLTVSRSDGDICESSFAAVGDLLSPGDLLVLNDTRVIPARLHGKKETGGNVEVFLVRRIRTEGEVWQCLLRCSKKPRPGTNILLPMNVTGRVLEDDGEGHWSISFLPAAGFEEWLERVGSMPLPPYIRRSAESGDSERYQTVFARVNGAVAAPTAGLHFTPNCCALCVHEG
jgi:S-adenosylmethionine:tRNA ribosyltransferase-isomerase